MVKKKFSYVGHDLEELKKMPYDDLLEILPARARRTLKRGMTQRQKKLIEKIKGVVIGDNVKIKTHARDMTVLPEMVDLTIEVHNGREFIRVKIQPEMIGHYLGEFAPTRKKVSHGSPGMGATRSSLYIPLK